MPAPISPSAVPPAVQFSNVSKVFGAFSILSELNLTVQNGERVAIIGPSGSGKTTLLRILMTLEKIDSGKIEIFGETLADASAITADARRAAKVRSSLGMVFQQFNLFPHRTAIGNIVEAPIYVRGIPRAQAEAKAMELLKLVGLEHKAKAYPKELSGGQQQRVAIARTLAMDPKIILFDEVTSALDPELVGEVLNVMRRLATESDITMLIVTHEMRFAQEISNRTIFMEGGKIVEDGPSKEIFHTPRNQRTREFLKGSNH